MRKQRKSEREELTNALVYLMQTYDALMGKGSAVRAVKNWVDNADKPASE